MKGYINRIIATGTPAINPLLSSDRAQDADRAGYRIAADQPLYLPNGVLAATENEGFEA